MAAVLEEFANLDEIRQIILMKSGACIWSHYTDTEVNWVKIYLLETDKGLSSFHIFWRVYFGFAQVFT